MLHLLNFYWSKDQDTKPKIKVYHDIEKETKSWNLNDYKFPFSLSDKKYCTGYYTDEGYKRCVNSSNGIGRELNLNDTQCFDCERLDGFKSAFFLGEKPNERIKKHLAQKHYIYLAYFEPGIIKVGTAAASRKQIRLIEQDALIFMFIAESDGFNVQKIERGISSKCGITETIKSTHKFKYMNSIPILSKASELLKSNYFRILNVLKKSEHFNSFYKYEDLKIETNLNNSNIFYPSSSPTLFTLGERKLLKTSEILNKENSQFPLVGKFLGLRGKFLLLENYGNIVAFKTSELEGRVISNIEDGYKYTFNINEQMSLI